MYEVCIGDEKYQVELAENAVVVNGKTLPIKLIKSGTGKDQIILDDQVLYPESLSSESLKQVNFRLKGQKTHTEIKDHFDLLLEKLGMDQLMTAVKTDLKAPMPGLVLDIAVTPCQEIKKGDILLVLEAMKMENAIKASADGVVKEIFVSKQQVVEKNAPLISFE